MNHQISWYDSLMTATVKGTINKPMMTLHTKRYMSTVPSNPLIPRKCTLLPITALACIIEVRKTANDSSD